MIGAIIGDIIGSTYEFHNTQNYDFELFPQGSSFTDDSICTIAIADAILRGIPYRDSLIEWCRKHPRLYPMFGSAFSSWFLSDNPQPYDSFGNGAAMRVSPIGWAFKTLEITIAQAWSSAMCSHSHPEGKKGAEIIANAVFILRTKHWKEAREFVRDKILIGFYGSDYESRLPKKGQWDATCQGCVPLALHLFLKSRNFEDAIRLAVSYGGDSDTLASIVGALAGAYYKIPTKLKRKAMSFLPEEMQNIIREFHKKYINDGKRY